MRFDRKCLRYWFQMKVSRDFDFYCDVRDATFNPSIRKHCRKMTLICDRRTVTVSDFLTDFSP